MQTWVRMVLGLNINQSLLIKSSHVQQLETTMKRMVKQVTELKNIITLLVQELLNTIFEVSIIFLTTILTAILVNSSIPGKSIIISS